MVDPVWVERGLSALALGLGSYFRTLKRRSRLEDALNDIYRRLGRLEAEAKITPRPYPLHREPVTNHGKRRP